MILRQIMETNAFVLLLFVGLAWSGGHPSVHKIEPSYISRGGGVVFIYGQDFSGDSFAAFNPNPDVGNKIWFYNDFETIKCTYPITKTWLLQNPQDSAGTNKMVCSLPARQGKTGSSWYHLKVTVDGQEVENAGRLAIHYNNGRTPTLTKIDHRYGKPGDMVTVFGKIFTKQIGPGASDLDNFDELGTSTLQNIFFGTSNCELMSDNGEPYGAYLDKNGDEDSEYGNITCKTTGSFVGPLNGTLLVAEKGQSIIDRDAFSVNSKGQAFFYHTLPEVTSIGPNEGGDNGGTFINIQGLGFDGYKDNTKVFLNDARCEVTEIDSSHLVCKSPRSSDVGSAVAGSRGLKYHLWKGVEVDFPGMADQTDALDLSDAEEFIVDQGFIDKQMSDEEFEYTGRLSGLFIAPSSGDFRFFICSNDAAELYFSNSSNPSSRVLIASRDGPCPNGKADSRGQSDRIEMVEGDMYYIEAVHRHDTATGNITNFLQISVRQYNTVLTNSDVSVASNENQGIYLKETRVLENQKITIEGDPGEITFTHMGIPSQTPVYADDTSDWAENLMTMFQWQCSKDQTMFKYLQTAEDPDYKLPEQGGSEYRRYGGNSEPFCGRTSWWKPWRIFRANGWRTSYLDMDGDGRYFCFAHKGTAYSHGVSILVQFPTKNWQTWTAWASLNVSLEDGHKDWAFKCIDLDTKFREDAPSWVKHHLKEGGKLKLKEISIPYDGNNRKDGYLDEVSIGRKPVTITRVPPANDYNTGIRMQAINVNDANIGLISVGGLGRRKRSKGDDKNNTCTNCYTVTFNPYTCQSKNEAFDLLGIAGATIEEMDTSATGPELAKKQREFLAGEEKATFVIGNGKVIIERIQHESPKMEGTFSLTFKDKTIEDIPVYSESYDLQELFESDFGLYGMKMHSHHWDECYDYHKSWDFEYIPGDQPEVEINTTNVINHGENFRSGKWTGRNGGVMIHQPGGDFFRLLAEPGKQTITVDVNGFWTSMADGVDDSFSHSPSLTPTISGVSEAVTNGNIELTISGTGFTTDETDFDIMIGNRPCIATIATSTSVTCTLENGPAGSFDVVLYVKSKGLATGSLTYTLSLSVSSISPSSGSVGGGTTIKITGTGFPKDLETWVNGTITIGGKECEIIATDFTEVKCITPPEDSSKRKKRDVANLEVTLNDQTTSGGTYNYDPSATPILTSLSILKASPGGGEVLTITGTSLGWGYGSSLVKIGNKECVKISWVDTEITCTLPALDNGQHTVFVQVNGNGYADTSQVSPIEVDFKITNASPLVGSHQGGTKIKIYGSGFGNCSQVKFQVGDHHYCHVDDGGCSDTEVSCTVTKSPTMHVVRNTGRHFSFGPGYLWEPHVVTVRPGEKVRWSWNLPVPKEGTGIAVHQVEKGGSTAYDGKGFNSWTKTSKGNFVHQFSSEGTFHYSTQDVIQDKLVFMSGSVVVAAPSENEVAKVTAIFDDVIEAETIVGSNSNGPTTDGCTFADTSCASEASSTESILFTFANYVTPSVTNIAVTSGQTNGTASSVMSFADAELTISGSGFSTTLCENSVKIGESTCSITSASYDTLICNTNPNDMPSQERLLVTVSVLNKGNAILKIPDDTASKLYVVPKIDSYTPSEGSWAGGAILTISGSGLKAGDEITTINIGGYYKMACGILEVTPSKISCTVPDYRSYRSGRTQWIQPIEVYLGEDQLEPKINGAFNMTFLYVDSATPSSGAVAPTEYSTPSPVTIDGTGFGSDSSKVSIYLRPSLMSGKRKRRSVQSQVEELRKRRSFDMGSRPKYIHPFWKSLQKSKTHIRWRSAGSSRNKRSIEDLPQVSPEDLINEIEEDYHPDVEHLHARTVKRDVTPDELGHELYHAIAQTEPTYLFRRIKRSADPVKRSTSDDLLEMSMDGSFQASVNTVTDTSVTFTPPELPAGSYEVIVHIEGLGNADASGSTITSSAQADSISPSSGSIHGGQTVTIAGNGFSGLMTDTIVDFGGNDCPITAVSASEVACITPSGADGSVDVIVTSNGVSFPSVSYSYSASSSPKVTAVSPMSGSGATSITIEGSSFGSNPSVSVGGEICSVTATTSSPDTISCDIDAMPGGEYPILISTPEFGLSNKDVTFTFDLSATSITPTSGSFGGGSLISITGQGFDTVNDPASKKGPMVKVCDAFCKIESVTDTLLTCRTPSNDGSGTQACDVVVEQSSGSSATVTGGFTYDDALTPQVTQVSPVRGGTGGGTLVTIKGTGFAATGNKVTIDESICDVKTESSTEIQCETNSHAGCIEIPVTVEAPDQGYGQHPDESLTSFYYIDRWSSVWTWGGGPIPLVDEFIVITEGQTILLDVSTPKLSGLLLQGGNLIFDKEKDGLNLQSEFILIMGGGSLQIGTEDDRYPNEAKITMHGNVRCTELPIYGCKVIAVREGTVDFHGQFIPMTWTRLSQTAEAEDTEIHLVNGVSWKPGSEIIVATTGGRASMGESEKKVIESVSADGKIITLTEPLKFKHISISQTFGDHVVETRGEVGLLTRNIKITGTVNEQFVTKIPACEKPFVANEEAMQSCFHGKFGEETGTDEFGATMLIHGPELNDETKHYVTARISYTEFTEVGQAFRVGRYPIHFHVVGNVIGSYVRGNAIHRSYNRACTLHAINNLIVEHNVLFNIKGLSFFTEDGIEEDNILQYNLAVYTRQSNSLLNPDIQPGAFWIVNPNNVVQHNAVVGSTHFGYWYRVLKHPDGPSRTTSFCPARAPMGTFFNNSAHSCGLYGIWLFTATERGMHPTTGTREKGYCDGDYTVGRFGDFLVWNTEIGVELVEGGAIIFENVTALDNEKAGIEMIHPTGVERQNGEEYGAPGIKNSVIIGHSKITEDWTTQVEGKDGSRFCSTTGIKNGWWGNDVIDTEFYNFDRFECAAMTNCARCKPKWSSGKTQTKGLKFVNSPNRVAWLWTMDGHYHDLDGSLCGSPDCKVVQKREIYDPDHCVDDTDDEFSHIYGGGAGVDWLKLGLLENETLRLDGYVCDETIKFHSVGYNSYAPSSLQFNDGIWYNKFGSARTPWRKKPPYKDGWAAVLQEGVVNRFHWYTMDHITNITYKLGAFGMAEEGAHILLGHNFTQSPDVFTFNGEASNSSASMAEVPTYDTATNTEWHWEADTKTVSYILSSKDKNSGRKKRAGLPHEKFREIQFRVFRCLYDDCLPPPPPTMPAGRPDVFLKWSSDDDWASMDLYKPTPGNDGIVKEIITIPPGVWMVLDEKPPKLARLYIYGVLEIGDDMDNELSAEIILIQGDRAQLVCGFADNPHKNKFDIILRGDHYTEDQPLPNGPNLGAKAIGVFGKLQLHGLDVGVTWTRLSQDALAGTDTITLDKDVDPNFWAPGAEILISPTSYEPTEGEKHVIKAIAGRTLTLETSLKYTHLGREDSIEDGSKSWKIAAEVGLLTRNIRIIGENYPGNEEGELAEEFGARVLVSKFEQQGVEYKGYAKISNVEWIRGGQEGWTDRFDPRYSLAFLHHGDSVDDDENNKESYVKKCTFNYNYNAAIGLFDTNNVLIEDTVTYRTLEYGLRDEGVGNRWIHNLIVYTKFVGIHKNQRQNPYKRGCIMLKEAWDTDFKFNAMSGCERAGLSATGHICKSSKRWEGNVIHSSQDGVFTNTYSPALEIIDDKECVVFRNFFIYKVYDYAFYTLTHDTVEMENNLVVDCGVGVHPFLIRPKPETHQVEEKYMRINNTVFVARSNSFDCTKDKIDPSYLTYDKNRMKGSTMWPGRNWHGSNTGHAGVLWPIFSGIGVPLGKPWVNGKPKSFPLLTGTVYLNDITFANFNPGLCDGQFDTAIRTNPRGDDMQFPILAQGIKFVNSSDSSRIWMDHPIDKLIVNEHCVDMHCDGLKKALLIDKDGSVIGDNSPGTIIPDAAYEWEGNPSAGLGYYRVPKTMYTEVNGDKIEFEDKMPNTGIVRNDQCSWVPEWMAYKCHGINHRLLIIESMDVDSLDRRLSPVAMLANPGSNGYIDLINGPQDFSCCFGYACQKRISNFYSIVGTNMMYEVHLTSTPPIHMRYRVKNNQGGDPVLLKIFFPKPQRIDIFAGDNYVAPNNIDLTSDDFNMLPPDDQYIPNLSSLVEGDNYFDPNTGFLYLLLRGTMPVDYKIQPSVVTKIGATIDMENFFEEDVVNNIAGLLGIDPKNIKLTNIVREGSSRKKREAEETVELEFTIQPPPVSSANETAELSYNDLQGITANVTNAFQSNSMGAALGLNITGVIINEPIFVPSPEDVPCFPQDEDPEGDCYISPEDNSKSGISFAEQSQAIAAQRLQESLQEDALAVPTSLIFYQEPGLAFEMAPFGKQAKFYVTDSNGDFIEVVGAPADPWIVTASIARGPGGNLINNVTAPFVDGYATFDNMALDLQGNDYVLNFEITYPTSLTIPSVNSSSFSVGGRPLAIKITEYPQIQAAGKNFSLVVTIWDGALDQPADSSITSALSSVECTLSLLGSSVTLDGTLSKSPHVGGNFTFADISVSGSAFGLNLKAVCDNGVDFIKTDIVTFNVHEWPVTGLLRKTSTAFKYKGVAGNVQNIMAAFQKVLDTQDQDMDQLPSGIQTRSTLELNEISPISEEIMNSWPIFDKEEL